MSILLDALRKSEAQRRLGEVPTLQTPVDTPEPEGRGLPAWLPTATVALAAVIMAWVGWVQYELPDSGLDAMQGRTPGQPVTATTPTVAGIGEAPVAGATPDHADRDAAGQPQSGQPATAAGDDSTADQKRDLEQSFRSYADEQSGAARTGVQRRSVISLPTREALPRAAGERTAGASGQDVEPAVEGPVETMSYWQIPQSTREGMPELRITVLVYAERPDQRFLLVNGQRVREKDDLGKGVVLEEIQRDRAIFSYRNYIFHLKSR